MRNSLSLLSVLALIGTGCSSYVKKGDAFVENHNWHQAEIHYRQALELGDYGGATREQVEEKHSESGGPEGCFLASMERKPGAE